MAFVELHNNEQLDEFLAASNGNPAILFKYSDSCGISARAYREMARLTQPVGIITVQNARDLSDELHVRAGQAIGKAAASSSKRVALVASCDHGHGHDAKGPYGYTSKSKEFDDRLVELIKRDDLSGVVGFGSDFAREAKADSYWQMLMLHGALGQRRWRGEFISYEAPTYFGMLCAAYEAA